jgi:uncharacterized repeat protein (TIGR01451 family)
MTRAINTLGAWVAMTLTAALAAAILALIVLAGPAQTLTAQGVDLNVRKSVSPKTVAVGEKQTFTIRVSNEGNHRARGVTLKDPLPGKVRFIGASTSRHVPGGPTSTSFARRSRRTTIFIKYEGGRLKDEDSVSP